MNCPGCGQRNPPTALFCTGCGCTLSGTGAPAATPPGRYAGFGSRLGAFLVDWVLVYVIPCVAGAVWISQRVPQPQDTWLVLLYPVGFVMGWLYWAGLESSGLQATLGKRAFGLQVTDLGGQRISFGRATGRYFGKILSMMLFYIGFLMAAFTPKRQALHDIVAGTLVVLRREGPAVGSGSAPVPHGDDLTKPFYR